MRPKASGLLTNLAKWSSLFRALEVRECYQYKAVEPDAEKNLSYRLAARKRIKRLLKTASASITVQ